MLYTAEEPEEPEERRPDLRSLLGPPALLAQLDARAAWVQAPAEDAAAFARQVAAHGKAAELEARLAEVLATVGPKPATTLFALRALPRGEHARVQADGAAPGTTALPWQLFLSHALPGAERHTVMRIPGFTRKGKHATTKALGPAPCPVHGGALAACVERLRERRARGERGKLRGCSAAGVCLAHPASTQAMALRSQCAQCLLKKSRRVGRKLPPTLHAGAFRIPRGLVPGARAGGPDACVRRALLRALGSRAFCPDPQGWRPCAWTLDDGAAQTGTTPRGVVYSTRTQRPVGPGTPAGVPSTPAAPAWVSPARAAARPATPAARPATPAWVSPARAGTPLAGTSPGASPGAVRMSAMLPPAPSPSA
jgi:hypothetical protein